MIKSITLLMMGAAIAHSAESQSTQIVALTLLGEARGEGAGGMYRVACVIQERQRAGILTAPQVCLKGKHFSCWNGTRGNMAQRIRARAGWFKSTMTPEAIRIARAVVAGRDLKRSIVGNADHYCTITSSPYWAKGKKPVAVFGQHKFFKLNKKK